MFGNKNREVIKPLLVDTDSLIPTTLAEGMTSKDGKLYGSSSVKISGAFFGDIDIEGTLVVAGSGSVHGNVKAEDAKIYGAIEGNVSVAGRVHIHPSGKLIGDVTSASLAADEGATFVGKSSVVSKGLYLERGEPATTFEPIQSDDEQ